MQLIFEIEQFLLAGQGEFIQKRDGMSNKMIYEGDCSLLVDRWYLKIQIILDLLPASSSSILTSVVEFDRRRVHARETSKSHRHLCVVYSRFDYRYLIVTHRGLQP